MATADDCRAALDRLAARMDAHAEQLNGKIDFDRPLACTIKDLGIAFHGRLTNGRLVNLTDGDDREAKIRLTATSDDLVSLVDGSLDLMRAWTSGRVSISASPFDLLKLRRLL